MLLSALDPALLIYEHEHWQNRQPHCFSRFEALLLHRRYCQRIAMSHDLAAIAYGSFPWDSDFKSVKELRDLRMVMLSALADAHYVNTDVFGSVSLQPDGLTCEYVAIPEILDVWKRLLCGCVEDEINSNFDVQIATWDKPTPPARPQSMILAIEKNAGTETHHFPLVWNNSSWATRLASLDQWPDLHRCVELHFQTNAGMQDYPGVRNQPLQFECTDGFWKSVDELCNPQMRLGLIKAITKKVYGILDGSLHDEPLGSIRRFRVTSFWRVHYRDLGDKVILEEFGEHDMGL